MFSPEEVARDYRMRGKAGYRPQATGHRRLQSYSRNKKRETTSIGKSPQVTSHRLQQRPTACGQAGQRKMRRQMGRQRS
jgi:hypothetical protein